ncbi:MAG: alginate lyase family protein, partial [Myxococcota bacterium]
GGLLLEASGAERWQAHARGLRAEIRNQIHPDGAHQERSPMYHCLLLEQVLDLLNVARAVRLPGLEGLATDLQDTAGRMCGALGVWLHPDGEIALFSDSAFDIAPPPSALFAYARALGVSVQVPQSPDRLEGGGYVRLADDRWHLIASVEGPAPAHQPGHAHCDALAFELSFSGQRIVTDTGVFEYAPGVERDAARATCSHATLEIDGREQAEIWAAHRVGGRPRVGIVDFQPGRSVEASCCSWSTPGVVHHRRFELGDAGLRIHDRLEGRRAAVRFALPLAPGLEARLTGEPGGPRELRVALSDGELRVDLPGATEVEWHLESRDYFPSFGRRERRWCLTGSSQSFEAGTWRFRVDDGTGAS